MTDAPRLPVRIVALSTVLALACAFGAYSVLQDDTPRTGSPSTLHLTPEDPDGVSFTTFEGTTVALSSLRGTPLLVNFFASTCVPCVTEMPALEQVHQELGDRVTFLGLALQDRPEEAMALVRRTGVTYRTGQDRDASVITGLGGTVLPTTVLLDAKGTIVASHSGKLTAGALRKLIADELGITT